MDRFKLNHKEDTMKVLIVGSGGREHAIAWSVAKSDKVDKIYCAPGNAGIAEYAECVNIGAMEFDKLVQFAKEKEIDLTVIGMDDPLVAGVVDAFEAEGLRVFVPNKAAAILEGGRCTCLFRNGEVPNRVKGGRSCTWKRSFNLQYIRRSKRWCKIHYAG